MRLHEIFAPMRDVLEQALQFKSHLRLEQVDENRVVLIGEREHYLLSGRPLARVASLIDGRRTDHELLAMTGQQASAAEILYAPRSRVGAPSARHWVAARTPSTPSGDVAPTQERRRSVHDRAHLAQCLPGLPGDGPRQLQDRELGLLGEVLEQKPEALSFLLAPALLRQEPAQRGGGPQL